MDLPRRIVSSIKTTVGWRRFFAYVLLGVFVTVTPLGAAFIYPPAGLLVAGATALVAAYLLGAN